MPTCEWHIPFTLTTSLGTFTFNQGDYPRFNLDQTGCKANRRIRTPTDDIPQGDGEILHERFTGGYEMTLVTQPWLSESQFACAGLELGDTSVATMRDELYGHLWALLRPDSDFDHRLQWTPTGMDQRMLDEIALLDIADPRIGENGLVTFEFTVDTGFPYAISVAQQTINVSGAGTITNNGNVEFWPVIRVNGPAGFFIIENLTTGLTIDWDSTTGTTDIGSGEYAEIDTFKGTIFLNGDETDLSSGLQPLTTDFFPLIPGANSIFTTFSDADFLVNDSFA